MKKIPESKRSKQTGKGKRAEHLGIDKWIINRDEFAAIKDAPLKLLIDLAAQYNGFNNGNLSIAEVRHRWPSRDKTTRAERWLIDNNWIIKTKIGGLGIGPNLYAVTWWPIDDCKGKHHYQAETVPSHAWLKTRRPDRETVRAVPYDGTGNASKTPKIDPAIPSDGTRNGVFRAA